MAFAEGQESHKSFLSETKSIQLVMPSSCVIESLSACGRKRAKHNTFVNESLAFLREVKRDRSPGTTDRLVDALEKANMEAESRSNLLDGRLHAILAFVVAHAELISPETETYEEYLMGVEDFAIRPPDRLILTTILADAEQRPGDRMAFLSANSRDFDIPEVRDALTQRGVRYFKTTAAALGWLRNPPPAAA